MLALVMMAVDRGPLRVVGRYALYNEIAAGGMATVHAGRLLGPVGFARTVAIKRLHPQFAKDPEFVSMFLDEARLAARVQHPNVVATIDVVATDGELFLIMDYVRGESLARLIRAARKRNERVPPRIANAVMCGFLHGLHAAHEAKNERGEPIHLVHRDVSPQNVLVGSDGIPRVLDFGIAKAAGRIQVTRDGQIKGKLSYMPPEQLAGRELTRAVDVYAAAVVMWEALTAERLFKGETESETLAKILRDPIVPPSQVVKSVTSDFDKALLRALSREPSTRHATARELALDFERASPMASPTEVGEWVERLVGADLSQRELRIAEIEDHSTKLPSPMEEDSASDLSSLPIRSSPTSTLLGMGPGGLSPMSESGAVDIPFPLGNDGEATLIQGGAGKVSSPRTQSGGTFMHSQSQVTLSALHLPVRRRWPLVASIAGLLVLLGIVGMVLGKKRRTVVATPPAMSVTAPSPAVAPSPVVDPAPTSTIDEVDASAEPVPMKSVETRPRPTAAPSSGKPASKPAATRPAAPRKDCDPPFTIDANGRKKYKLECM